MAKRGSSVKVVSALTHPEATRKNIPTAEYESLVEPAEKAPINVAYERRDSDLDPQLIWRGKYEGQAELAVAAQPLYIQEKIHPKALIDDLLRETRERRHQTGEIMADLFSDFNGLPHGVDKTEFYKHDQNWSNRMILGDSLLVMTSLAEREGLRGKVQCIYIDPPYGIKFNSNFQWSTTSTDVKDNAQNITREPEQVKAFRDTWRDGVHSYLNYLRDRLIVARDLLSDSGAIFVQIGDENMHRVRSILDEVFGEDNFISTITFKKTHYQESDHTANIADYLLLYARKKQHLKFRKSWRPASIEELDFSKYTKAWDNENRIVGIRKDWRNNPKLIPAGWRPFRDDITLTQDGGGEDDNKPWVVSNRTFYPGVGRHWRTHEAGRARLLFAGRVKPGGERPFYVEGYDDSPSVSTQNIWTESLAGAQHKVYVVQTNVRVVQACVLMVTDPGDLVLDPTCGSGTTAYVAEQWGRRWITIDTSRVALALSRARIMGARYPFYILADSREGQVKEAEIMATMPSSQPVFGDIRNGFVYARVPHITLRSIANNAEIDVIWERWRPTLAASRDSLNAALAKTWQEWEIPRDPDPEWPAEATKLHADWWQARVARQREIDSSIAAKAEFEYLYDRPYEDKKVVRVAGPCTVESLSPFRMLNVGAEDELIDPLDIIRNNGAGGQSFVETILEDLKIAGVQQAHKADRIVFTALTPWPGDYICADGRYLESDTKPIKERRAAILIGPEFGTVRRVELVAAAKEAADAGFDVLIACAFAYEARTTDFNKLGLLPVLKARMNADLHMSDDLKNTGKGNLFVIFGEPDIELIREPGDKLRVKIKGVDVFKPNTGEVVSNGSDGIACWLIDTDYNEESFFVRHAYFLGAGDPYGALKATLKSEIDEDAWSSLNSDVSRTFPLPKSGRIAVKVINHLGDEVMKIFKVT